MSRLSDAESGALLMKFIEVLADIATLKYVDARAIAQDVWEEYSGSLACDPKEYFQDRTEESLEKLGIEWHWTAAGKSVVSR